MMRHASVPKLVLSALGVTVALVSQLPGQSTPKLDEILARMERAGNELRSMSCDIFQQKWTRLLNKFDTPETGTFAFLREDDGLALRRDIREPGQHSFVIRKGKAVFFQPAIKQATESVLGQNKGKAEEFLLLGFGGDRSVMAETYDTSLLGPDEVAGRQAYKIELTPKVAGLFTRIVLWVDAEMWIPIQQQLFEPTRDYLLVRFDNIRLNPKLKDSDFELKLPQDVTVIRM